jgi:hypothetical protein
MSRIELPPPGQGEAFFRGGEDWWHDALISEYPIHWSIYSAGYKMAADRLVNSLSEDRYEIDFLIFPILYLYRHYLELALKGIIRDGESLLDSQRKPPEGHVLDKLWVRAEQVLRECSKIETVENPDLSIIDNCIRQFATVDPSGESFRYARRRDESPVEHAVSRVNVRVLKEEMDNASREIEMWWNGLSAYLGLQNEAAGEGYD